MAALAADSVFRFKGSPTKHVFSGNVADIHYAGALLFIDTGGGVQAVPAAGDTFAGIVCYQQTVVTAGDPVEAYIDGLFLLPLGTAITAADEGDLAIIDISGTLSDNPADIVSNIDSTGAANDIAIGRIYQVTTEGMWVKLEPKLYTGVLGYF